MRALVPCGTASAYVRHRRRGETPCEPCVLAHRAYRSERQAARTAARASTAGVNAPRRPLDLTAAEIADFWSRVDRSDGCWTWTRDFHSGGYGIFRRHADRTRKVTAHRVAFALEVRPLLAGEVVRHTCDNPPCCNPAHLVAGTQADNVRDAVARGRQNLDGLALGRQAA